MTRPAMGLMRGHCIKQEFYYKFGCTDLLPKKVIATFATMCLKIMMCALYVINV